MDPALAETTEAPHERRSFFTDALHPDEDSEAGALTSATTVPPGSAKSGWS